jgi:hypothetical protein
MRRKRYHNADFRVLFSLQWDDLPGRQVLSQRRLLLRTNLVAAALGTTSFRLQRTLQRLLSQGFLKSLEVAHGETLLEFYELPSFLQNL